MTTEEAKTAGYEVIEASKFEVGLTRNGKGIRTWWCEDFEYKLPALDHPAILEAIDLNERISRGIAPSWKVCFIGTFKEAYELSLVKEDFAHGFKSWGWDGDNKIVISVGGQPKNPLPTFLYGRLMQFAEECCKDMNAINVELNQPNETLKALEESK